MMHSPAMVFTAHRFRSERRTGLFWLIGFVIYASLIVSVFPSVKGVIDAEELPLRLRLAFNFASFDQLSGFLGTELMGVIMPILLPFFGIIMLSFAVAGAEERGRLDLILANPLPRRAIVLGSTAVAWIWLFAITTATGMTIKMMAIILNIEIGTRTAILGAFALWPLAIAFSALAMLLSAIYRQRSTALAVTGAIVLISYLALVISRLVPSVDWLKYGSAFYFYGTAMTTVFWVGGALVLIGAAVVLTVCAVVMFDRRDIYA